ncbi:hypothetical protein LTR08_008376 [Meristemomyces frigidus]|nr:hypothetical protein LTR08_008376 [Meristemomyces frigidus]
MAYYGDEGYDHHHRRHREYPETRRSDQYLSAGGGGLYRTRSSGHAPQPVVNNIYVDQVQDANLRAESPYPSHSPHRPQPPSPGVVQVPYFGANPVPPSIPVAWPASAPAPPPSIPVAWPASAPAPYPPAPYPPSPDLRGRRLGENLIEDLAGMALRDGMRSRSRGRTEGALQDRPDFAQWKLEQKARELEEEQRRQLWEREAELRKLKDDARREKAESDADAERKRLIRDYEEKKRQDAQKAKDEDTRTKEKMDRVIWDYEDKKRKDVQRVKDEEIRFKEKMEREKHEAKEEEQRIKEKMEREARETKAREEREWKEFLQKQKEKDDKEKAAKKAEKEKFESEMRRRLAPFGYTEHQIDVMVDEEKAKKYKEEHARSPRRASPGNQVGIWTSHRAPVYAKVHRDYLSVDTLIYYDIPYRFDDDPNYIIIMREMDKYETEVLFNHTKSLQSGRLLLDAPKKEPQYAWYRKRNRSHSRGHRDKVGILEFKKVI